VRVTAKDYAIIISDAWGSAFEPAPVTPTGRGSAPYELLSGTIQAALRRGYISHELEKAVVAPAVMGGNTGLFLTLLLTWWLMCQCFQTHGATGI